MTLRQKLRTLGRAWYQYVTSQVRSGKKVTLVTRNADRAKHITDEIKKHLEQGEQ